MANIVLNAAVSKFYKEKASGIASALRGKSIIGFMDVRPVKYTKKTKHIAGLKYDKNERTFFLTSPKKADAVNIGVFISTYDMEIVHGKIMAKEELRDVYELPSVAAKFESGGYDDELDKTKRDTEVFPKKVSLKIIIATSSDKLILRNSEGFIFTCDFKDGRWYTLRPGTKKATIYNMQTDDLISATVFKDSLPFPALDRKIYENKSMVEFEDFDIDKHIKENV
jgi:hypothetical protein